MNKARSVEEYLSRQAPEARVFQEKLVDLNVPAGAILLEERASTVRDNITFSQRVLEENGLSVVRERDTRVGYVPQSGAVPAGMSRLLR